MVGEVVYLCMGGIGLGCGGMEYILRRKRFEP